VPLRCLKTLLVPIMTAATELTAAAAVAPSAVCRLRCRTAFTHF
jgi:hypothetical protein